MFTTRRVPLASVTASILVYHTAITAVIAIN